MRVEQYCVGYMNGMSTTALLLTCVEYFFAKRYQKYTEDELGTVVYNGVQKEERRCRCWNGMSNI